MAELNERTVQRLRAVDLKGDELVNMFKLLVKNAELVDSEESVASLQYKTDGTAQVGEYIPQLQLVVTRVTKENQAPWGEVQTVPNEDSEVGGESDEPV